ncbi:MAG: HAD family hydrolase [Candidatus Eremiobacteraeota bacterium]|nr:HAD family hydrolase [Candidatus Eremiobacteraeota bacterium]
MFFDRDGTLIEDVAYNGNPDLVVPAPGARDALNRLRAAGIPVAVVSNQSGVGRGMITIAQVQAVNCRVDELLGPFAGWFYCPHAPEDECECRKPKPKLIFDAAASLGVSPECCVMVGDKPSDMEAAKNAGAIGLLIDEEHTLTSISDQIIALRLRPSTTRSA